MNDVNGGKKIKTFKQVLEKCPNLPAGRPNTIMMNDLTTKAKTLNDFRDGGMYIALVGTAKQNGLMPGAKGLPKEHKDGHETRKKTDLDSVPQWKTVIRPPCNYDMATELKA